MWWAEDKGERAAQEGVTRPTHCNQHGGEADSELSEEWASIHTSAA